MIYNMTLKGEVENFTSGQGHDLTRIGHVAYNSIRLVKTNTLNSFWSLYLVSFESYCQKTVGDL